MFSIFPGPILNLPEADIPLKGIHARLSQGAEHQIVFMEFSEDVELPPHSHESQWGMVIAGQIDLTIGGIKHTFSKGDHYFLFPKGWNIRQRFMPVTPILLFLIKKTAISRAKDRRTMKFVIIIAG